MPRRRANDAKPLPKSLGRNDYFALLQDAVDNLWDGLAANSEGHANDLTQFPYDRAGCDLLAAIGALQTVLDFLRFSPTKSLEWSDRRKCSRILEELKHALFDLWEGSAPAPILMARKKGKGRRADVSSTLAIKGHLAGLMYCQVHAGMTREQAAKWIVNNMSPKLAPRISRKPTTARMVEEWLDRFGGKHAEQNAAREAYQAWSQDPPKLTKQLLLRFTESLASRGSTDKPR